VAAVKQHLAQVCARNIPLCYWLPLLDYKV